MKLDRFTKFVLHVAPWVANGLVMLGFGLVFALAFSSSWGWHPLFAWMAVICLAANLFDRKNGFLSALTKPWKKTERFFGWYLLTLTSIALGVNILEIVG